MLAGLLGGRTSSRCSSQHLAIRMPFKLSAVCRCSMPLESSVGTFKNQVERSHCFTHVGLRWDNWFPSTALSMHKSLLLQGAMPEITGQMLGCRRGVKAGVIRLNTCSILGANLGTFERERGWGCNASSFPMLIRKTEITADCPSLRSASTLNNTTGRI